MGRMTEKDASGRWQVKGMPWEKLQAGHVITKETSQILYGCLCKLKDYEECGMSPDQLKDLQYKAEDAAAYVCDKLCRYPREVMEQEELDEICEECPVSGSRQQAADGGRDSMKAVMNYPGSKWSLLNGSDECVMQDEDANMDADTWSDLKNGCPLVPIPERKQNACSHGFAGGWNACLDEIENKIKGNEQKGTELAVKQNPGRRRRRTGK